MAKYIVVKIETCERPEEHQHGCDSYTTDTTAFRTFASVDTLLQSIGQWATRVAARHIAEAKGGPFLEAVRKS